MTLGSPIDKHIHLWPELFAGFGKPSFQPKEPIEWHNYYDYGDPVGFELDSARERFAKRDWGRPRTIAGTNTRRRRGARCSRAS